MLPLLNTSLYSQLWLTFRSAYMTNNWNVLQKISLLYNCVCNSKFLCKACISIFLSFEIVANIPVNFVFVRYFFVSFLRKAGKASAFS